MHPIPADDEVLFLPLGGVGEIGMNCALYGHAGRWLMVDCGVTFADDERFPYDLIMADPSFITEQRERLEGLILTHGHEDHIGAVARLWNRLQCPVYASPFTAELLRRKLSREGLLGRVPLYEIPLGGDFQIGRFQGRLISMTHSILEPSMVVLNTGAGRVVHTGDWKLDPTPLLGNDYDQQALETLGSQDVLAMVCDSTNATKEGHTPSEFDALKGLRDVVARCEERVFVTLFASNLARVHSLCQIAQEQGRYVSLAGRALWNTVTAAQACGYLTDLPDFVPLEDIEYLPRNEILVICTGSQGEKRSALRRVAEDSHPDLVLQAGDSVVFSAMKIPGNEESVDILQALLRDKGADIITDKDALIHVSGHPRRDELRKLYHWVQPQISVPVHGEDKHQWAHAELAEQCGVQHVLIGEDWDVYRLHPEKPEKIGAIQGAYLVVDEDGFVTAMPEGDMRQLVKSKMADW